MGRFLLLWKFFSVTFPQSHCLFFRTSGIMGQNQQVVLGIQRDPMKASRTPRSSPYFVHCGRSLPKGEQSAQHSQGSTWPGGRQRQRLWYSCQSCNFTFFCMITLIAILQSKLQVWDTDSNLLLYVRCILLTVYKKMLRVWGRSLTLTRLYILSVSVYYKTVNYYHYTDVL